MRQIQMIFCDDVRQEVGGKLTYVGTYAGSMLVSAFQAVLSKFCVAITTVLDRFPDENEIALRVLRDKDVIAERILSRDELAGNRQADRDEAEPRDEAVVQVMTSLLVFMAFEIEAPCTLRVRASIGKEVLRGVGLRILPMPAGGEEAR